MDSSCHSGTALDLPYVYSVSGNIKEPSELLLLVLGKHTSILSLRFSTDVAMDFGKGVMGAAMDYARGDVMGSE